MTRHAAPHPLADALPVFLAALWPLGIYTQIPLTPILLGHAAALAAVGLAAVRWRAFRALRPPFEYWWPCAAAAAVFAAAALQGRAGEYAGVIPAAAFFLAPVILVQHRPAAAVACLAFSVAGAIAASLHWAAEFGLTPPTVIALDAGLALSGPTNFPHGVLNVLAAALAGLFAAAHPALARRGRALAMAAVAVSMSWLVVLAAPRAAALARPLALNSWTAAAPEDLLLLLLAMWITARVMARSILRAAHPESPGRPWAPAILAAGAVACIAWGAMPGPGVFLVLGLIAAHDAPWAGGDSVALSRPISAACLACVSLQIAGVLPLAVSDPRNQAARCEEWLEAEAWDDLNASLDFLEARHPARPAYTILRARALAAQGWPESAAAAFCANTYPEGDGPTMRTPMAGHQRALLDTLRDQASRLPHGARGLFFERALIHAGKTENALDFMALHTRPPDRPIDTDPAYFARALAFLIGAPELEPRLAEKDASTLQGYLEGAGVRIARLPQGFRADQSPLLLRAIAGPDTLAVEVWPLSAAEFSPTQFLFRYPADVMGEGDSAPFQWGDWQPHGDGGWVLELASSSHSVAAVHVNAAGNIAWQPVKSGPPPHNFRAMALFVP